MDVTIIDSLWLSWTQAWLTLVTAAGVYYTILALSRVWGQRQFVSSSTYDLAFVFAVGSLAGRVILVSVSLGTAVLGLVAMFSLHSATGWLHHRSPRAHRLLQNSPILLVADGEVQDDLVARARMSRLEVDQQVRLAGHACFDDIRAVVLEPNGRISVIDAAERVDPEVFAEVRGAERLRDR